MVLSLTLLASLLLLVGIVFWSERKPGYSHRRHTISELGEQGSPVARQVNYGLFLPVGVLLLVVAARSDARAIAGLAACVGIGYVVAAFFPCDVGSPSSGSWRQWLHNLGGAVEYIGGAYWLTQLNTGYLVAGYPLFQVAASVVLVGMVLVSMPSLSWRGLAQRLVETSLFGTLLVAIWRG